MATQPDGDETFLFPASFAQRRLWLLDQLEPGRAAYNIPLNYRIRGQLDVGALERAFSWLIARHEVLRTTFEARDGSPWQVVHPFRRFPLRVVDLRDTAPADREPAIARLIEEEGATGFDLARGPLLRAMVVSVSNDEHVLLITLHHITADGTSLGIFQAELSLAYNALARRFEPKTSELGVQYADFAIWQLERLDGAAVTESLDYWKQNLAHPLPVLDLPSDRPRDPDRERTAARIPVHVPAETSIAVRELARALETTPFVILLAVFQLLLRRYSGSEDVIVGAPIAGRTRLEMEPLIGFFVNTLALRVHAGDGQSFRSLVGRTRTSLLGAMTHQEVPFERVVETIQPERDRGRNPVFDALFSVQPGGSAKDLALSELEVHKLPGSRDTAKFDLQIILNDVPSGFRGMLEYDADLFDEGMMSHLGTHFVNLVTSAIASSDAPVESLAIMDARERVGVIERATGRAAARPNGATVVSLVRAAAEQNPSTIALEDRDVRLTYADLVSRADAIARMLTARGVKHGDRVAVHATRSAETMIASLGVLSAGGAYVPIDPSYPVSRTTYMLEQSRASALLVTKGSAVGIPPHPTTILLELRLDGGQPLVTIPGPTPEDVAYVLYTSGSTGVPKGVAMGHAAMVNLLEWQRSMSSATVGTRTLQFAALSFDVSFQEIFATWSTGGTLVLIDDDTRRDAEALARRLSTEAIERLFLPFVALEHLAEAVVRLDLPLSLREIITAGEQLRITDAVRMLMERLPDCLLVNQYGPTETHVVTAHELRGDPSSWPALPPIGRPIDNVGAYVLDGRREPVPDGLPGELYIGGAALAHGYLDDPSRTAERFVLAPWDVAGTAPRLYRTGDLARVRGDGAIDYLGRADDQVKIRGFRVELGEIERVLSDSGLLTACAVILMGEESASRRLVGYCVLRAEVVAAPDAIIRELKNACATKLPEYMVPAAFVFVDDLPLTPSGKVDRRALRLRAPVPVVEAEDYVPPATPLGVQIAAIWAEILRVPRVSTRDSFFVLGGHSLLATRMISKVRDRCAIEVPLRTIFDFPIFESFVTAAEQHRAVPVVGAGPIQPLQRRTARAEKKRP